MDPDFLQPADVPLGSETHSERTWQSIPTVLEPACSTELVEQNYIGVVVMEALGLTPKG